MNRPVLVFALLISTYLPITAQQNWVYRFPAVAKIWEMANPRLSDQPFLIAPYDSVSKELRLISGGRQHIFEPTATGFKWLRAETVPAAPEDFVKREQDHQYFLLDPKGNIYFAGTARLYQRKDSGWTTVMEYPEDWYRPKVDQFLENPFSMAIIAKDILLVATTAKNLFEIYDLSQRTPKLLESISYSSVGANGPGFKRLRDPIKVLTLGDTSWVLIPGNGRLFKLRHNEGWSLNELNVPWHAWHAGSNPPQGEWKNVAGAPYAPLFPGAAEFIPDPLGSSFSLLVPVYNMEEGVFYDCEVKSDSNSIRSTQKFASALPDWVLFLNDKGIRTPLKDLIGPVKQPMTKGHDLEVTK